jgi:hypothetical protein
MADAFIQEGVVGLVAGIFGVLGWFVKYMFLKTTITPTYSTEPVYTYQGWIQKD